jgi:hypothetical protein
MVIATHIEESQRNKYQTTPLSADWLPPRRWTAKEKARSLLRIRMKEIAEHICFMRIDPSLRKVVEKITLPHTAAD